MMKSITLYVDYPLIGSNKFAMSMKHNDMQSVGGSGGGGGASENGKPHSRLHNPFFTRSKPSVTRSKILFWHTVSFSSVPEVQKVIKIQFSH